MTTSLENRNMRSSKSKSRNITPKELEKELDNQYMNFVLPKMKNPDQMNPQELNQYVNMLEPKMFIKNTNAEKKSNEPLWKSTGTSCKLSRSEYTALIIWLTNEYNKNMPVPFETEEIDSHKLAIETLAKGDRIPGQLATIGGFEIAFHRLKWEHGFLQKKLVRFDQLIRDDDIMEGSSAEELYGDSSFWEMELKKQIAEFNHN
jgi:hypothetical protein